MLYNTKVVDYFMNPRNVGKIDNPDAIGIVGNPKCGDVMKIYLKINKKTEVIEDVKFETFGCAAAIATSSISTELIKGKTITEALHVKNSDVVDALGGLPPVKIHCSLLAQDAIQAAIANYYVARDGKLPEGLQFPATNKAEGEDFADEEEEVFVSEDHRVAD